MLDYKKLDALIKADTTGILKGYDIGFLLSNVHTVAQLEARKKADIKFFNEAQLKQTKKPKQGDFVEYEKGKFVRIARIFDTLQLSNAIGVYISTDKQKLLSQASGGVWDINFDHLKIKVSDLIHTGEKRGSCWTFSLQEAGGQRGVDYHINFNVFRIAK